MGDVVHHWHPVVRQPRVEVVGAAAPTTNKKSERRDGLRHDCLRSVIPTQTCLNRFKADFLLHRGSFTMILRPTPELRSPQADTVELTAKVTNIITMATILIQPLNPLRARGARRWPPWFTERD